MATVTGLTTAQAKERERAGLTNVRDTTPSRRISHILRANLLTRFNAIIGTLFLVVVVTGSLIDALFGVVVVANALLGTAQEWRAKRTLDRLQLLHAPACTVLRDGIATRVPTHGIVTDDVLIVKSGDEIPIDGVVLGSESLHVNEAALTGEADDVPKSTGDRVSSGTYVSAGAGWVLAVTVGSESYAQRLARDARRFSPATSEIVRSINRVLRITTWSLLVLAPLQWWSQFRVHDAEDWQVAVNRSVAGLVGMVPEGLVLLTTLTFLTAAVQLSRRQVLVQQLSAVETLARVDTVCIDKTGTLTTGDMQCTHLTWLDDDHSDRRDMAMAALEVLADDPAANSTLRAVAAAHPAHQATREETGPVVRAVAFDSTRKWKAMQFGRIGTWFLGAPDRLAPSDARTAAMVETSAGSGERVLMLAHSPAELGEDVASPDASPVALVHIVEQVREDAAETVQWFARNGVDLHVLSGDHPATVMAIGSRLGIPASHVHGRVTPEDKHRFVRRLQAVGRTVAMTGDGVNDVLAVKAADIGIAMDNAAPATTSVAEMVLLDGRFSHLVEVIDEGRRVIGNVERVALLFVTKNVMSAFAIVSVAALGRSFPFLPRQMTLVSTLGIGIPAFLFAIGRGSGRFAPGFLRRVVRFSLPAGSLIGMALIVATRVNGDDTGTVATITALILFHWCNVMLSRPWTLVRVAVLSMLSATAVTIFAVPPWAEAFGLVPRWESLAVGAVTAGCTACMLWWVVARSQW